MIISPPFLTEASVDGDDDAARYSFTGNYPVNGFGEWHNGVHLVAPAAAQGGTEPVRAVADGTVLYVTPPDEAPSSDPSHAQNYSAFSGTHPEWTDKGLVILQHTAEIGHDGTAPVRVTFYSVYMHLNALVQVRVGNAPARALRRGDSLHRKAEVGRAGQIYGQPNHLHFEICMDEANLRRLLGLASATSPIDTPTLPAANAAPTADGRTDVVFGATHVYLPTGTPVVTGQHSPTTHLNTPTHETLQAPLWVSIDYAGNATLTSRHASGESAGQLLDGQSAVVENRGEYDLHTRALSRHQSLAAPTRNTSSPSGWYELLRFGRNLGRSPTDRDPLPAGAEHWRQVATPAGLRWANLNAPGTFKFSDADFPSFLGWQCIGDDDDGNDQRCDSTTLRTLLLRQFSDLAQREAATARTQQGRQLLATRCTHPPTPQFADKLKRLICRFPSEFDGSTIDARYAHVHAEPEFAEHPENWTALRAHIGALCCELPQEYRDAQWHFEPLMFIRHMRKCGWMSRQELARCLPSHALRRHGGHWLWEEVGGYRAEAVRRLVDAHCLPLNIAMHKYGISNSRLRMVSFLGNAFQESAWLHRLTEFGEGAGLWYRPWFGRGFLQLTRPGNYLAYWEWRGRGHLIPAAVKQALNRVESAQDALPNSQRSLTALDDDNFDLTAAMLNWRSDVQGGAAFPPMGDASVAPTDSAGHYAILPHGGRSSLSLVEHADAAHVLERMPVDVTINGQTVHRSYCRSETFWNAAAAVNLPGAALWSPLLNGFEARCCAYGVLLGMLTEQRLPNAESQLSLDFPEGYTYRTEVVV